MLQVIIIRNNTNPMKIPMDIRIRMQIDIIIIKRTNMMSI